MSTREQRRNDGLTVEQRIDLHQASVNSELIAEQKKLFLEYLAEEGTVFHAAKMAGVRRQEVYRWRAVDKQFAKGWDDAMEDACDKVENSLYRQAITTNDFVPKIVYLKAHRAKYRDRLSIDVNELDRDIERRLRELLEVARRSEIETSGASDSSPVIESTVQRLLPE